ncbi:MAG: lysophospholipid acyltransferase family protein [Thermoanaerobaculia bacterium]
MTTEHSGRSPAERPAGGLATAVASVTGNTYLIFGTLVLSSLVVLAWPLSPSGRLGAAIARTWARGLLLASGVRVSQGHRALPDPAATYVYMPNHQSRFDIPVLLATLPGQVRFLAKRSLLQIPVFGWALRTLGFVPVDRDDRSRARDMFGVASARLAAGISLVVFPEGTRGRDGRLLPFQRGAFLLALRAGCPILPVGLEGTLRVQPRGSHRITPGRVVVRYGEPVPTAGLGVRDRVPLMSRIRREVATLAGIERTAEDP